MKYVAIMLATIGLIAVSAANHAAQAEATLYTSFVRAGSFRCNAVNVSHKTLSITISIVDGTATDKPPTVKNTPVAQTAMPGEQVSGDFGTDYVANEAYCVVEVSGTGDRNDVRAALIASLAKTFSLDGGATNNPTFLTRVLEAH
jgi:hypothetical protein